MYMYVHSDPKKPDDDLQVKKALKAILLLTLIGVIVYGFILLVKVTF